MENKMNTVENTSSKDVGPKTEKVKDERILKYKASYIKKSTKSKPKYVDEIIKYCTNLGEYEIADLKIFDIDKITYDDIEYINNNAVNLVRKRTTSFSFTELMNNYWTCITCHVDIKIITNNFYKFYNFSNSMRKLGFIDVSKTFSNCLGPNESLFIYADEQILSSIFSGAYNYKHSTENTEAITENITKDYNNEQYYWSYTYEVLPPMLRYFDNTTLNVVSLSKSGNVLVTYIDKFDNFNPVVRIGFMDSDMNWYIRDINRISFKKVEAEAIIAWTPINSYGSGIDLKKVKYHFPTSEFLVSTSAGEFIVNPKYDDNSDNLHIKLDDNDFAVLTTEDIYFAKINPSPAKLDTKAKLLCNKYINELGNELRRKLYD